MKAQRRFLTLLLVVALLASIGLPAFAAVADTGFTDVAADAWYAEAVIYCRDGGIMSGTSETEFSPAGAMNRAMLATVLWRMAGSEAGTATITFSDVPDNTWYTDAVRWAVHAEIISGYNTNTFGANDPVTREQIATMLYRYEQYQNGAAPVSGELAFADAAGIADWAKDAVLWAAEEEIVTGRPGNFFDPKTGASRAEVAVMLSRYLVAEDETTTEPEPEPEPEAEPTEPDNNGITVDAEGMISVNIAVGSTVFAAKLYDNTSARAIIEQMPFSLDMDDYAGQEKVKGLPFALPSASTEQPSTIRVGDLYLWSGNQLVLFYTTFSNSYSYVPIGYIEDPAGLTDALGRGSVTVSFGID